MNATAAGSTGGLGVHAPTPKRPANAPLSGATDHRQQRFAPRSDLQRNSPRVTHSAVPGTGARLDATGKAPEPRPATRPRLVTAPGRQSGGSRTVAHRAVGSPATAPQKKRDSPIPVGAAQRKARTPPPPTGAGRLQGNGHARNPPPQRSASRPQAPTQPSQDTTSTRVNLQVISNLYRVKPDVVTELIDNFLTTARERMEAIGEALDQADSSALQTAAHSLKGSSGTLGAMGMADICADLEARGRDQDLRQDPSQARASALRLRHEFEAVRKAFERQLAEWSA